jgi:sigma-B regulation protein RsbU (phosphoserine phosphatase)
LPAPLSTPVATEWRYIPSASLGGDSFDYLWLDDDRLAIYLLDVSGHGVGPALLSISVMNMLRTRGLRDADFGDPGSVLRALNDSFQMSEHSMFFTMWYGVYSRRTCELSYAGAGHPPSLLMAPGTPLRQLKSQGLVVGIMTGQEYTTEVVAVPSGSRLLLYSDGVFEIQIGDKIMWSIDDFIEYFGRLPDDGTSRLDRMLAKARTLKGSDALDDDFSIVELTFP